MNRKDFFQLLQPLTDKLYRMASNLIPDDLQAEQLVIDSLNAYLIKEKSRILAASDFDSLSKKDIQIQRRLHFKGILRYMGEIGVRRSNQLTDQTKFSVAGEFASFYGLAPQVRQVMSLRFDFKFTVEEIEDITSMAKYEVIEKLHNGRFLLLNEFNQAAQL